MQNDVDKLVSRYDDISVKWIWGGGGWHEVEQNVQSARQLNDSMRIKKILLILTFSLNSTEITAQAVLCVVVVMKSVFSIAECR